MQQQPTNYDYALIDYTPEWKEKFAAMQEMLRKIFGDRAQMIEHVGSTSVVGMKSKPVIDALVVVDSLDDLIDKRAELGGLGYAPQRERVPEHSILLSKTENGRRVANIHIYPAGHERISWFIEKRDYLQAHPEEIQRYEEVKRMLSDLYPDDYQAYQEGKERYLNHELVQKMEVAKRVTREL